MSTDGMSTDAEIEQLLLSRVHDIPDFPKPGVLFKDLNPLFADAAAFAAVLDHVAARWDGRVDMIGGIEARGLIVGAPLAQRMGVGFLPVRKAGKLPGETVSVSYDLEYGSATIEVPAGACAGHRVLVIDDVLATGGTIAATAALVNRLGAELVHVSVLLELDFLGGRQRLAEAGIDAVSAVITTAPVEAA